MIQSIGPELFARVAEQASRSPRRRMNHNFHTGPEDNPHRFLNVLLRGTYVRPHRHIDPPKAESFLVLEGRAAVLIFDDEGRVTGVHVLGDGVIGVDLPPGIWHSIVALSDTVVCFEVKPGPWIPATDKDFAPWAPKEGEAGVEAYLAGLLERAEAG
jgi:cupin fold WbuC family metalloprotein